MYTAIFYFRSGNSTSITKMSNAQLENTISENSKGSIFYHVDTSGNTYVIDMTQVERIEFLAYKDNVIPLNNFNK